MAKKRSAVVTIEGTVTPSTELARGEQKTVEYDEHVQRLIDGGFVAIVPDDDDSEPQPTEKGSDVTQQVTSGESAAT